MGDGPPSPVTAKSPTRPLTRFADNSGSLTHETSSNTRRNGESQPGLRIEPLGVIPIEPEVDAIAYTDRRMGFDPGRDVVMAKVDGG